jgi:hypothetical protein
MMDGIAVPTLDFNSAEDFHLLPEGAIVTGMEPLRDVLLVFTTAGVWGIYGLALDLTDAGGNPQQRLEPLNRELILWREEGIASFGGAAVIPATSDLFLFDGVSSPVPITGGARNLYRSYVRQGFNPGQATVHRGHYLLPILDASSNWVDLMVWRLDLPGRPFTRWSGHGGQAKALFVRPGSQLLLGGVGRRVESYAGALERSAASSSDGDGSSHNLQVTTRTVTGPGLISHLWRRFRARMELSGSPTVTLERAEGKPGTSFTVLSNPSVRSDDGESIYSWAFNEKAHAIRFRLTVSSSSVVLRATSAGLRVSGKHRP